MDPRSANDPRAKTARPRFGHAEHVAAAASLLNGLSPRAMQSTEHVLRVLAARLERYERQLRAHRAAAGRGA